MTRPPTARAHIFLKRVATALLGCVAQAGHAQSPPPAVPANPPPTEAAKPETPEPVVAEVVVTGERPAVEKRIDRTIYNLSNDLAATAGSAVDVLRNLPSISVDIDGNPALRGDGDVQILIDGRLAPEFNNSSRGAALAQLGADNIDRIEVITNPPASFKREGSAGIINIVTKRRAGARTASVQASVGSGGRYGASTTQGLQRGKLKLRGSAGLRHDLRERAIATRRIVRAAGTPPETQASLADRQVGAHAEDDMLTTSVSLGADYDLTAVDRMTVDGSFSRRDTDSVFEETTVVRDADGDIVSAFDRTRRAREPEHTSSASIRYRRAGEHDGDGLTVSAERSETSDHTPLEFTNTYSVPAQAPTLQNQVFDDLELEREFSVDYVKTLADDIKFTSGYDLERDDARFDNSQTLPAAIGEIGAPDPDFTNQLRHSETVHALYGSCERPFERWTVLAGLRLEQTEVRVNQVTSGERHDQDYFRAFPTLHLSRKLNEQQSLQFSYGRRLSRPQGQSLNPYRIQSDAFTIRQGNPQLGPVDIDSIEAGWSYDEGHTSLGATLFARRRRNDFAFITTPISPTVVLITPANVGESVSGGLEFASSGRLGPEVDIKLSGTVYYNELDAENLGFARKRSAYTHQAKAALNWRASAVDVLQVNVNTSGKRLTPQGSFAGFTVLDLGYRHRFRPDLSFTATISDVLATRKFASDLDTPALRDTTTVRPSGRIVYVGVTWSRSDVKPEQQNFEYGE